MKNLITLILSCFFTTTLLSQENKIEIITSFETSEKNAKTIILAKEEKSNSINFGVIAENKSTKEYTKCKWVASITLKQLDFLMNSLESIEEIKLVENSVFKIKKKKGKIAITVKNTKCTSEHKLYKFQKKCNRELKFVIKNNNIQKILADLKKSSYSSFVSK